VRSSQQLPGIGRTGPRLLLAGLLLALLAPGCDTVDESRVRQPQVAGSFYPGQASELAATVEGFLAAAESPGVVDGRVRALVVPHAGYVYSGQVAAEGYRLLDDRYKRVFIIASNHSREAPPYKFSVSNASHYATPLGRVPVSKIAEELLAHPLFAHVPEAHSDHIIEVHLPLLQKVLGDFEIIPIVTGGATFTQVKTVGQLIDRYVDDETLIIVSSDLSHYQPYDEAVARDRPCIAAVEALQYERVVECEACGLGAILILLEIAQQRLWGGEILDYKNSGDTAGSKDRVVGYSSIAFHEMRMGEQEKAELLELSRRVLDSTATGVMPEVDASSLSKRLRAVQGCFVTLQIDDRLRGCIGHILPREPLYRCVIENTLNAALRDGRFQPVRPEEIGRIEIEISLLSVPAPYTGEAGAPLLDFLSPLEHGVVLRKGNQQSTFLPQVWESLPGKQEYLTRLCVKGGMPAECWRDPETEVSTYAATVFHERERDD